MRFTAAAAVLATSAMAVSVDVAIGDETSTAFVTQHVTVTQCPESVTDCPARSMTTSVLTNTVPMTTSTVYSTLVRTITSCAATVTNCPAHSTVVSTETISVSTTVCPVAEASATNMIATPSAASSGAAGPFNNGTAPMGGNTDMAPSSSSAYVPMPSGMSQEAPTEAAACPSSSVTAVTKSYTTVLTSVEYSTVAVPCATQPATPSGANPGPAGPAGPVGTGVPVPPAAGNPSAGGNQSCSGSDCPMPPATAGAASLAGSAMFAAVAGVAALILA